MPQAGHTATALPVAASTISAAVSISASAGLGQPEHRGPPGRLGSSPAPQSRRHARCLDTVDCASPSADTRSVTRAGPLASRRTIISRAGSPSDRNKAAAGASLHPVDPGIRQAIIAIQR